MTTALDRSAGAEPVKTAPFDPRAEVDEVLRGLIDKLFYLALTLGVVSFVANLVRARLYGWTAGFGADIATLVGVILLLSLRRRVRPGIIFWFLVAFVGAEGVVSLLSLGLASAGMLMLTATSILVGVFRGLRAGLVAAGLSCLCVAAAGISTRLGLVTLPADVEAFLASPATWATQGTAFAVYSVSVIVAASAIQRRLLRSLEELTARTAELEAANSRLQMEEERYRLLAESVTDVVFKQGVDLKIIYASPSAERLFGYTLPELRALGMGSLLTPESLALAMESYQRGLSEASEGEVDVPLMEYEYVRKDGSTFWGELSVVFVYDGEGNICGSQGVLRDVTDRKRAEAERRRLEEELRHSEKMRVIGQLAGGVAHDFNNQLGAIMGFADLIALDDAVPKLRREHARGIVQAAERSAELTRKLLDFARKGLRRTEPIDVHALVHETVTVLERSIDPRIAITQHLDASPHVVLGDGAQLQNALLNLGLNSRDAMPEGGEIRFSTVLVDLDEERCEASPYPIAPGRFLELSLSDTGQGIEPEGLERIFEPFFTTKAVGEGTGMGLAAVDGAVRSHRGAISVTSEPGRGATFSIYLPLLLGATAGRGARPPERATAGRACTVMVVDDEALVCETTAEMVEELGHVVEAFTDPAEALARCVARPALFDAVVMDLVMPAMTGRALFLELRKIAPDLPVLLMSGHGEDGDARHILREEGTSFVQKPFRLSQLAEKLVPLFARGGASRE